MSTDILHETETDLAELAGLPGEIRTKVKAGLAELRRLRDAIEATIAGLTGGAQATLASLQALAAAEPEDGGSEPSTLPAGETLPAGNQLPPAPAGDGKAAPAF